jgi:hypothetical protein
MARVVTAGTVDIRRVVINNLQAAPRHGGDDSVAQAAVDHAVETDEVVRYAPMDYTLTICRFCISFHLF